MTQELHDMVEGLKAWHPCLICGTSAHGPEGGVVCPGCRQKVASYDEMKARLAEAVAGATPVCAFLPYAQAMLPPKIPGEVARALGSQLAEVWTGFPLASEDQCKALPSKTISDVVPSNERTRSYLADHFGRTKPGAPAARVVPEFLAEPLLRLESVVATIVEAAYGAGHAAAVELTLKLDRGVIDQDWWERATGHALKNLTVKVPGA